MNLYPLKPQKFPKLIMQAFKSYWQVFKAILPLILLIALVKDLYIYFGGMPINRWLHTVIILIMVLLEVYLWATVLYSADATFKAAPVQLNKACRAVYHKLASIYAGFFALVIGFCLLFFIGYFLSNIVTLFFANKMAARSISMLLLFGLPVTIGLVLCFFVLPLLVCESLMLWQAFQRSVKLVGYRNWLQTFVLYAIYIILLFIVSPNTLHGQWLARHYLSFIFDVIIFVLMIPLTINLLLLLLNDLRLQQRIRGI